jgi:glycosyltransferase involved in cell wall biosynthesis
MPGIVERLAEVSIIGLGDPRILEAFPWSHAANMRLVECRARRYSMKEQVSLPLAIPSDTDLFFSPYYTIPLLYRGPLAVTVHDMSHRVVTEIVSNTKKRLYAQVMYRGLRKRAAVIFTVSNFTKTELLRLTTGPREDNILPTHLGISEEWYGAAEYPPTRTGLYFVHVGNIKPYKNLRRLVEAFLSIRDRVLHDLVIVGQSEGLITGESQEFFDLAQSAGGRIHLTGPVSHQALLSLVAHAQALIMPSLYEGFGLPPIEAMAAGTPTIVARAASLPEVCGDATLYCDPLSVEDIAEKLVRIASDAELCQQLTKRGLLHSRQFTWSACAAKTADALHVSLH